MPQHGLGDRRITRRSLAPRLAALAVAALGAGCGRRSDVRPPEGADNTYPRGYPPGAPSTPPKQ